MRITLTAKTIAALRPAAKRVEYWDVALPGFGVRVTPSGVKTFGIMFRHAGRLRRLTIGRYPPLTLADARSKAKEALRAAALGSDPAAARIAERHAGTFEELASEYLERWAKKRKKSWKDDERIINRYLLPQFKHVRPRDVTRAEIRVMLEAMAESAPIMANRTLACLRKIFNWGISQDLVESNPCQGISRPGVEHRRDRVLSEAEIKRVWAAMETGGNGDTNALFKLRLLLAQRGQETASMKWSDIDWGAATWTIPAERAKNGLSHRVPLSEPALKILRRLQSARKNQSLRRQRSNYVFPGRVTPSEPISGTQKAHERIRDAAGVDYRAHDLRRTAASMMTSMGTPRLVVGRILNHSDSDITAVYDRHSYDREKREALDRWSRKLLRITTGLKAVEPRKA